MMTRLFCIICALIILVLIRGTAVSGEVVNVSPQSSIEITTSGLPFGYKGDGYSTLLAATGGDHAPYFMCGSLPKGLSLSPDGRLSGRLKVKPGTHTVLVTAVDPDHPDNFEDKTLALTVYESPRMIKQSLPPAMAGQPYTQSMSFSGGSPDCILSADGLPQGLTMDESGRMSGTPETGAETVDLHVTVTDPGFPDHRDTRRYRLTVFDALAVETDSPPPVQVNTGLGLDLNTSGGSGKVRFECPDLPVGLTLSDSGRISGTPSLARGSYPFTVLATEQAMPVTVSKTLTLTLVDFFPDDYEAMEESGGNRLTPGDPAQEHTFNRPGDTDRVMLDLSRTEPGRVIRLRTHKRTQETRTQLGILGPDGRTVSTFDETDGGYAALLFVCTAPGFYPVTVSEERGETGDFGLFLLDLGPKVSLVTRSLPDQQNMGPIDLWVRADKGSGDYAFEITGLPPDLSMDSAGHITGRLTAPAGDIPLVLTVRDRHWGDLTDTRDLTLTVVDFFPDSFEPGDGDFTTPNVLVPDGQVQTHTFHTPGDRDGVRLDLSAMEPGHVLHIETRAKTRDTRTVLSVYDENQALILSDRDDPGPMSDFYMDAAGHKALFLILDEENGHTGDYDLSVMDTGKKLSIQTPALPDALTRGPYFLELTAVDGSGDHVFSAKNVPPGLSMDPGGLLHGDLSLDPGTYDLTFTVTDARFTGMSHTKPLTLTVVEFFPDDFEAMADNDFDSTVTLLPDGAMQEHTLHRPGDRDMIQLDLSAVPKAHVLDIRTHGRTKPTPTLLDLYDPAQTLILSDGNKDASAPLGSRLVTECPGPGIYVLSVRTLDTAVGDYAVSVRDGGPKVRLVDQDMPDVLINGPMHFQVMAADGSGHYRFSAGRFPDSLSMTGDGLISGDIAVPAGLYPIEITVSDPDYPGMADQRLYTLKVVDYFPDEFDVAGDGDEQTRNTLVPGDEAQYHCFHEPGDVDWIRLDLTRAAPRDVIVIGLDRPGKETQTVCTLTDARGQSRDLVDNGSVLVFSLTDPEELLLCVREQEDRTGEYRLSLNNSGQPLALTTGSLAFAESVHPYSQPVQARGGCGNYTFKIIEGSLPAGLTLDEHSGLVSGQNTAWGDFGITILAMDLRFPVNATRKNFTLTAYMGEKLHGEDRFEFPHFLSGSFSLAVQHTQTLAFPGDIRGGTPGNLRYRIIENTIPDTGFSHTFDPLSGTLTLSGLTPVSCNQYTDTRIDVTVEARDQLHPNNTMLFHYDIPAECLDY